MSEKKSMRQAWLDSFGSEKEVHLLASCGEVAAYVTKDRPDGNPFGRSPVFHVWRGDDWLYCGQNMRESHNVYTKAIAEQKARHSDQEDS